MVVGELFRAEPRSRNRDRARVRERFERGVTEPMLIFTSAVFFADTELKFASHILNDVFIETISRDMQALRRHDASKCDDRNVGRAARRYQAPSCRRRRKPAVSPIAPATGSSRMMASRAPAFFAASRTARLCTFVTPVGTPMTTADRRVARLLRLCDEVGKKFFRHFEIGDDAVAERAHDADVRRRLSEHHLRLFAYRNDLMCLIVHRHD